MIEEKRENIGKNLQNRLAEALNFTGVAAIVIGERECSHNNKSLMETDIEVKYREQSYYYTIHKPISEISDRDIKRIKRALRYSILKSRPFIGPVFRFFGWWFIFSGMYAMFSVCPYCGQAGCPVGIASIGFLGGFFALIKQNWKAFKTFIQSRLFRGKGTNQTIS